MDGQDTDDVNYCLYPLMPSWSRICARLHKLKLDKNDEDEDVVKPLS